MLSGYGAAAAAVASRDYANATAAAANADTYLAAHGLTAATTGAGHSIGPLTGYGPVSIADTVLSCIRTNKRTL